MNQAARRTVDGNWLSNGKPKKSGTDVIVGAFSYAGAAGTTPRTESAPRIVPSSSPREAMMSEPKSDEVLRAAPAFAEKIAGKRRCEGLHDEVLMVSDTLDKKIALRARSPSTSAHAMPRSSRPTSARSRR